MKSTGRNIQVYYNICLIVVFQNEIHTQLYTIVRSKRLVDIVHVNMYDVRKTQ